MSSLDGDYTPRISAEEVQLLEKWHELGYQKQRASLPRRMSFMGLDLWIGREVFAPDTDDEAGDAFHQAVAAEVRPGERVLDLGTGSGVSGILAAIKGADVVAIDINPKAVACARDNAERNHVADRIRFVVGDVFDGVDGDFDLIVFDPPFRWFKPRDMLEAGSTDEGYRTLRRFIAEVKSRLRPDGRVLLNFGTTGDIAYLYELINLAGIKKVVHQYGEMILDGYTARYYIIRLTAKPDRHGRRGQ